MKLAVSGKGGVGKSTVSAGLALLLAARGKRVLCLDADPDPNLAAALGLSRREREAIVPMTEQIALIEERTGSKTGGYGGVFKLNPDVSDVASRFAVPAGNTELLVLGAIRGGGSGCACAAGSFVRALVTDLILYQNESLVMDMEAGVEHLGRATAGGVDVMLCVVEPGERSIDCARTVLRMAKEIGLERVLIVANKLRDADDEAFIRAELGTPAACLAYDESLRRGDRDGINALDAMSAENRRRLEGLLDTMEGML